MVLKDGEAVVQITGRRGSTPPGRGAGAAGTVGAATTPGETACCTDGTAASAATEGESGTSSAATGAWRSASTDWGSTHRSQCVISGAATTPLTLKTFCRSKRNLRPSNYRRTATVMQRRAQPAERERRPPLPGGWFATEKAFWHDRTEHIRQDTPQT